MNKFVCKNCIDESYLEDLLKKQSRKAICSYCQKKERLLGLSELAKMTDSVLRNFYEITAEEPTHSEWVMMNDEDFSYFWEREGQPLNELIQELLGVEEVIANDLIEILRNDFDEFHDPHDQGEGRYNGDVHYKEIELNGEKYSKSWLRFENRIKNTTRFFGHEAFLKKIFGELKNLETKQGESVIVTFGPGTTNTCLFRARVVFSDEELVEVLEDSSKELGLPPAKNSGNGRMNAHGIGVLYGALSECTALAEVRPPIGSKVIVGKFNIKKNLQILDVNLLSALVSSQSYFDPDAFDRIELINFLKRLSAIMSRPVMPKDQSFDYLPTQIISDYLAYNKDLNLDGILYRSSYDEPKGCNIAIFNKSAKIHKPIIKNVYVSLGYQDSDGFYTSYKVQEEVDLEHKMSSTARKGSTKPAKKEIECSFLDLDKSRLKVYDIRNIKIETEDYEVDYSAKTAKNKKVMKNYI